VIGDGFNLGLIVDTFLDVVAVLLNVSLNGPNRLGYLDVRVVGTYVKESLIFAVEGGLVVQIDMQVRVTILVKLTRDQDLFETRALGLE
jgi:hypothetical protein